jgi:hypothetical protein
MLRCLVLGDSLAVGMGAALGLVSPTNCDLVAKGGARAEQVARMAMPDRHYSVAIISIGSNDAPGTALARAARRVRLRTRSDRIVWILPYERQRAALVAALGIQRGDRIVDAARFRSADGLHPSSYFELARILTHNKQGNGSHPATVIDYTARRLLECRSKHRRQADACHLESFLHYRPPFRLICRANGNGLFR